MDLREAKEMGVRNLTKLFYLHFKPKRLFININKNPNWLFPFILIVAIETVSIFSIRDIKIDDDIARMKALNQPKERIERVIAKKDTHFKYLIIPGSLISIFMGLSILSLVFYLLGIIILRVEIDFIKIVSVLVWTTIVNSIGTVIKTLMILLKGTTYGITTSMAMFLQTPLLGQRPSEIYLFLSKFDLFMIWKSVLLLWGFSMIYHISIKKSAGLIVSLWLIWSSIFILLIWGTRLF